MKILDPCCSGRMFWFEKDNPYAIYGDIRRERLIFYKNRVVDINPNVLLDVTSLPFSNCIFDLVVFDPPHLIRAGENGWMRKKYGVLPLDPNGFLKTGFRECFRVLKPSGTLIFKWNETGISIKTVLGLAENKPLFGHRSGKKSKTHWICFMKEDPKQMSLF